MKFREYLSGLGGTSFLYANASNGLKDVLASLARSSGRPSPHVILPTYIPAKIYRASLSAGCAVRFYEVRGNCTFDPMEVESLLDESTVAILYIHYFGFPHQLESMRELSARRNIPLIEDCALTISARHEGKELGTYGDIAVFSMRKMFLYPEGGFLRLSDRFREFRPTYAWRVRNCFSVTRYLKQKVKYIYIRVTGGGDPLRIFHYDPVGSIDPGEPQVLDVKMMSSFSRYRLKYVDVESVARRRRENFAYLADAFSGVLSMDPVHRKLPEGCTPYSFPLLVRDGKRDYYREQLLARGIVTGAGWPEAPFSESYPGTTILARSMLELPVHQALTRQQLLRSVRCLRELALSDQDSVTAVAQ